MTRSAHQLPIRDVGRLSLRAANTGLILGRTAEGGPALLRLFRPQPTRVVLIGGLWLARTLVFRALALGAYVLVRTADPRRWHGLGEVAVGSPDRVRVVTGGRLPTVGQVGAPVLHILDMDGHRTVDLEPGDSWQATLTVSGQLTDTAADALTVADAAIIQRIWAQQADYVAARLGVDPDSTNAVQSMPDNAAAVLSDGAVRFVWLAPTPIELRMFGQPQRT